MFEDIHLDPELNIPLYQQLYTYMRIAILTAKVKGGMKLPATRALADDLKISRNTTLTAYQKLLAEGYLESVQSSGTFVARVLPEILLAAPTNSEINNKEEKDKAYQPRISNIAQSLLAMPKMGPQLSNSNRGMYRPFLVGVPALEEFPFGIWTRLTVRQARHMPIGDFNYQKASGYAPLREAIASHISATRRVHCTPDQIVIVPGSQGALDLAVRVLVNVGDPVWMEDPGYLGGRGALLGAGARIVPVPVDEEGLLVEVGIARESQARLVYLTPSHQFPLGVTMSLTRRKALLEWAERADAYILEDDYDSEYRFTGRPLPALQGLDNNGRVIYIGTFSKVLFPACRIGYLVVPPQLINAFLTVRVQMGVHSPILEQAVLADFMAEGHFARHVRRMRYLYSERRNVFLEAARQLPLEIQSPETGTHCVGWLPDGWDDLDLARYAAAHDIELWPVSLFSIEPSPRKGVILGYGAYRTEILIDAVQRLGAILRQYDPNARPESV